MGWRRSSAIITDNDDDAAPIKNINTLPTATKLALCSPLCRRRHHRFTAAADCRQALLTWWSRKTIRRSKSGRERVAHTNNQTDQGKTFQTIARVLPMFQILRYRRFCAVATTTDDCLSLYLTMLLSINSKRPMLPSREYGDDEPTNYSTINPWRVQILQQIFVTHTYWFIGNNNNWILGSWFEYMYLKAIRAQIMSWIRFMKWNSCRLHNKKTTTTIYQLSQYVVVIYLHIVCELVVCVIICNSCICLEWIL